VHADHLAACAASNRARSGHAGSSGCCVDKAYLQQVKRQHSELLVLQVVGSDLTAFAVEDEAVGSVPGLDDVERSKLLSSTLPLVTRMFLLGQIKYMQPSHAVNAAKSATGVPSIWN
jgi:hypothetical protein